MACILLQYPLLWRIISISWNLLPLASILSSDYAGNEALFLVFITVPAVIAEYSLALWLLTRGRRVERVEAGSPTPNGGADRVRRLNPWASGRDQDAQ
jgi:hypothetical protein